MAKATTNKPLLVNPSAGEDDVRNNSMSESAMKATSSSPIRGVALMADGKIPEMSDFFKKTLVIDTERQGYHDQGWLTGNLLSFIPEVDVPTVDDSIMLCFESLTTRLGLPPNKFLVSIMNFLGCSLTHFNPNAIAALNSFAMLCECWLGIPPNSSLFRYYYSPACYSQVIYGGIGLPLRCHRWEEYIKASLKGCWKHSQHRWVLAEMHSPAPWENKLLYPPVLKDQWKELLMTTRLSALV
jgi:hypothetical protein